MGICWWNKNAIVNEIQMPPKKLYLKVLTIEIGCKLVNNKMPQSKNINTKAKEAIPNPLYIKT